MLGNDFCTALHRIGVLSIDVVEATLPCSSTSIFKVPTTEWPTFSITKRDTIECMHELRRTIAKFVSLAIVPVALINFVFPGSALVLFNSLHLTSKWFTIVITVPALVFFVPVDPL